MMNRKALSSRVAHTSPLPTWGRAGSGEPPGRARGRALAGRDFCPYVPPAWAVLSTSFCSRFLSQTEQSSYLGVEPLARANHASCCVPWGQ